MATKKTPVPPSSKTHKKTTKKENSAHSVRQPERRKDRLRARYPEVRGKIVDFISHEVQDGTLYFTIWFQDHTRFLLRYSCDMVIEGAEFGRMKQGNLKVIREYPRPVPR